jgi:heme O synthase-like polyprenyltransferase
MIELLDVIPVVAFLAGAWAFNRACDRLENRWMDRTKPRTLRQKD